jgi:ABC-type phosphate/phosphonate transport system substrate-binding protein
MSWFKIIFLGLCLLSFNLPAMESVMAFVKEGLPDLSQADKRAALEMWADDLGKEEKITASILAVDDVNELIKLAEDRKVTSVLINTGAYIQHLARLKPLLSNDVLAIKRHEGLFEDYVIVTQKESGLNSILQLRHKKISMVSDYVLQRGYLNYLLKHSVSLSARQFFSRIINAKTGSLAVLDVFFGRADVAIVAQHIFDLTADLNPAIRHELQIIHNSGPKFVPALLVMFKHAEEVNKLMKNQALEHQFTVRGQQLLDLFKINGLEEVTYQDLEPSFFVYP